MPQVQVIEPIHPIYNYAPEKLRVCAYARVSSDSSDQLNSFVAQVDYYTGLITGNEEWDLVDIYADEGITGTRADKRDDFQRMMNDCRKGKIDRILVKSVSRFSRNIRDCLAALRELKALGVEVEFEKERIKTVEMHDELIMGMFSTVAQEESSSISNNMRWSYQRRIQSDKFITCTAPYGYQLVDNILIPDETQAPVVRRIFGSYLSGKSMEAIADELTKAGIPHRNGKAQWGHTAIMYILTNEKYIGDSLLQKSFTTDTLPFRKVRNTGQKDRYYVTGSHEPIISKVEFEQIKQLLELRRQQNPNKGCKQQYNLSLKIYCGKCGATFRRRVTNEKVYWVCRAHDRGKTLCELRQIREDAIYQAFTRMYNKLKENSRYILSPVLDQLLTMQSISTMSNAKVGELNKEIAELTKQNLVLNRLRSKGYMDSAIFMQKSNEINQRISILRTQRRRLLERDADDKMIADCKLLISLIDKGASYLNEFDEVLFHSIVDKIIVTEQDKLKFRLIGGLEFIEQLPKEVLGR
jgi:site-specific DNA recombinase